jgi:predicted enzyme related to lactoylglutathione lyase
MVDGRDPDFEQARAVLYAKDAERVARFYEAVTELERTDPTEGFIALRSRVLELIVLSIPEEIATTIDISSPPARREETPIKLSFTIPSIGAARDVAPSAGGTVDERSLEWEFQGARICDGLDPEGNVFQLREALTPTVA